MSKVNIWIQPSAPNRIYVGWFMVVMGILAVVCTILMIIRGRYGVAAWNFMCVVIDSIAAWSQFYLYNEWKKTQSPPLTKS